jgi:hypothetical protein
MNRQIRRCPTAQSLLLELSSRWPIANDGNQARTDRQRAVEPFLGELRARDLLEANARDVLGEMRYDPHLLWRFIADERALRIARDPAVRPLSDKP